MVVSSQMVKLGVTIMQELQRVARWSGKKGLAIRVFLCAKFEGDRTSRDL